MATNVTKFDVSEYLADEETIAAYLTEILAKGDTALLLSAIGDIAKARGMSTIAEASGLGRESLYKALSSNSKPRFETIIKVLGALGVDLGCQPKKKDLRTTRRKRIIPKQRITKPRKRISSKS